MSAETEKDSEEIVSLLLHIVLNLHVAVFLQLWCWQLVKQTFWSC